MKLPRIIMILLLISSFVMMIGSCKKSAEKTDYYTDLPIAGFTWTGNDGAAPVTVSFVNTSENADSYEWNFGDGYSSIQRDPQHVYHNTGTDSVLYLVVLKATESTSGFFDRKSKTIVIKPGG